jgi:hypothetical protein
MGLRHQYLLWRALLDEATEAFWNAAQIPVAVIPLTTNAAIEDLDLHLAYDNTPGCSEREFFRTFYRMNEVSLDRVAAFP